MGMSSDASALAAECAGVRGTRAAMRSLRSACRRLTAERCGMLSVGRRGMIRVDAFQGEWRSARRACWRSDKVRISR
jgi:hypothetical protein